MNDRFKNISSQDLHESLLKYTQEYSLMLKENEFYEDCEELIDEIIDELKERKDLTGFMHLKQSTETE